MIPIPPGAALAPSAFFFLFPTVDDLPGSEIVMPGWIPPPYYQLLVHPHHMTVTVEDFYRDKVDVEVLEKEQTGEAYSRKILLRLQTSQRVVQFGIVRIDLTYCSAPVRAAIVEGRTPLGRILIEHNVLRHIEPMVFFRVHPSAKMAEWFGIPTKTSTYGRIGVIYCDEKPAIEVLEIVARSEVKDRRQGTGDRSQ